jgi:hypothetical protein
MIMITTKDHLAGSKQSTEAEAEDKPTLDKPICGLIMPISAMPPAYDAQHWADVRAVFEEAIVAAGMKPQMVSDSFESDVIQQRIIANVFNNPVVVCDVSGLNANVMFELGLRLASKKATIIVTDSYDNLPFDTRIIDHMLSPRNLRLRETREFIASLTDRIIRAHEQVSDEGFRPFLDNFAGVTAVEPSVPPVSDAQYIRDQLTSLQRQVSALGRSNARRPGDSYWTQDKTTDLAERRLIQYTVNNSQDQIIELSSKIHNVPGVLEVRSESISNSLARLEVLVSSKVLAKDLRRIDELIIGMDKRFAACC